MSLPSRRWSFCSSIVVLALAGCGGSSEENPPPPTIDAADAEPEVDPDTAEEVVDTAPPACKDVPLAVDPPSTLDPLKDGPYKAGRMTVTVPTLGPLTNVKVRIWYPAEDDGATPHAGRHAWVMFHHAVHFPTTIYDKYNGTFDRWASHGFVTFSIDGHKIYFPTLDGTDLTWPQQQTVAGVMDEAITYFLKQQEELDFPLRCIVDKDRGAVSGHSRGGGAALLVPTERTDGANVKAYIGFQPINPEATRAAPKAGTAVLPLFDRPCLWFDSSNDGDVVYPITAMIYERTRTRATHVDILGSKHTYTLDFPFPDQGGDAATITPVEHKAVQHYYAVPFLRAFVRDATPAATDLDRVGGPGGMGVPTAVSSGDATIRWRLAPTAPLISKFDEAKDAPVLKTDAGATVTLEGGMTAVGTEPYATSSAALGPEYSAVSRLIDTVKLDWDATDAAMDLPIPAGALTGKKAIVFETANLSSTTSTSGTHPLFLELSDGAGTKVNVAIDTLVGPSWSKRPRRLAIAYAPLSKFTGIDLAKVKSIRFMVKAGTPKADILVHRLRIE